MQQPSTRHARRHAGDSWRGRVALTLGLAAVLASGCRREVEGMGLGMGDAGTDDGTGDGDEIPAELEPAPAALRLLLQRQYRGAIRDLLGDAAAEAATPPDNHAINGF
ncbi:MAG: hypothetical protein KDK70_34015, partial [Myxococcales bacterium]|nr:hypothetical protein [Myxococcales bacterium]